jgi:hypothetical protein
MIDEKTGMDFPIFQSQLYDLFGQPNEGQFATSYLRRLDFSEFADAFAHVLDFEGNAWGHKIYGNYVMEDPLRRAFSLLVERGLAGELKTFDGCFNIRSMKGGRSLSVHSWAMAVDFNAAENPFGGIVSFSDAFIRCFADAGFEAGALWRRADGMHFQLAWTQDWRNSTDPLGPLSWVALG